MSLETGKASARALHEGFPKHINPEDYNSLLVIAPHPDDEVIACGGLIKAMCDLGRDLRVVVVSDGAASHPGSRLYPPERLAAVRRQESLAGLGRLGVAEADVVFCGFADGQSEGWDTDAEGMARLSGALAGHFDLVCLPSEDDEHPDHAKTRTLARRLLSGAGVCLSYTVWPKPGNLPVREAAEFALSSTLVVAKRAALSEYRTQLGAVRDDPDGFVIDAELFARFTGPVERFSL